MVGAEPVDAGPDGGAFLSIPFGRGFVLDGGSGWIVWFCGIISTLGADMLGSESRDQQDESGRSQGIIANNEAGFCAGGALEPPYLIVSSTSILYI